MSGPLGLAYKLAHLLRHRWRMLRGTPLAGVSMVARDLNGNVVMVRLSYGGNHWSLPGGGAKRGESFEAAAIRELAEETGCKALGVRKLGEISETLSGSPHTAHVFACNIDGVPKPDGREVVEAKLFPAHSLPHPRSSLTEARLDLWRAAMKAKG